MSHSLAGRLAAMVRKDLIRRVRSPLGVVVVLLFPVLFSLVLALAMGGGGGDLEIPKIRLLIENRDDALVGQLLMGAFGSDQLGDRFEVETVGVEGRDRLEKGEASALLILPAGLTQAVLDGSPATLELVRNPAQSILPEIAEQVTVVLTDLLDGGSRLLRGPLDQLSAWVEEDRTPTDGEVAQIAVATRGAVEQISGLLLPPVIELETAQAVDPAVDSTGDADALPASGDDGSVSGIFLLVLPGISVLALFMVGELSMRDLYTEQTLGTLRRQLAGPFGAGTVVAGKALFTACLSAISLLFLAAIGWAVGGRGVSFAGFLILSAGLVVAITGFTALVYGASRTERQGSTISSMLILVMGALGGSFIPLASLPGVLRGIAPFSLFYWGTSGYDELLRGAGLVEVIGKAAVLAGVGGALLWAGSVFLSRRLRATAT